MPSRGWKVFASLILAPAAAFAQSPDDLTKSSLDRAVACTLVASTVYAQLTDETAAAASSLAHRKCEMEWKVAKLVGAKAAAIKIAAMQELYPQSSIDETELRIANLRALAKANGDGVYSQQRQQYQATYDSLLSHGQTSGD